ncbi:MAG: hypothetical protein LAT67_00095 [Balneolales bacterium]|nr:hypothetical protein [Balneolales bacterium]
MMNNFLRAACVLILTPLFSFTACNSESEETETIPLENLAEDVSAYDLFLTNLSYHCGDAFEGRLTLEPEGDDMLEGDELLLVHFRECGEDQVKMPFHIQKMDGSWDRSRTWIFTRTEDGIDLRHDHRKPNGEPDDFTMYGGPVHVEPDPNTMEFISFERTEETGLYRGWRIIIEPGVRYVYGTHRGGEWSWRVDFDLTQAVNVPPAPWGHE